MLFMLICSILLTPSTPEDFLYELCDNSSGTEGVEFWSSHASMEVQSAFADPDSLAKILGGMQELTVNTGRRTAFEERGGTFRIEFGESMWTWIDSNGNLNRKEGLSIVISSRGNYTWLDIPVLTSGSISIGRKEKLITGIFITFLLLISTFILLIWAKRRYL
ncbi:MAG: hypothetical protein KAT09_09125 [Candidatus Aegiribacteria sp.]|nr:hypothetical protein [Candidatus Aegiribacteria sp.]